VLLLLAILLAKWRTFPLACSKMKHGRLVQFAPLLSFAPNAQKQKKRATQFLQNFELALTTLF
jgi:hypothetical protein